MNTFLEGIGRFVIRLAEQTGLWFTMLWRTITWGLRPPSTGERLPSTTDQAETSPARRRKGGSRGIVPKDGWRELKARLDKASSTEGGSGYVADGSFYRPAKAKEKPGKRAKRSRRVQTAA